MSLSDASNDDLNGVRSKVKPASTNAVLDKYTVQEKVVPLLKGIKTKEPAVMVGIFICSWNLSVLIISPRWPP